MKQTGALFFLFVFHPVWHWGYTPNAAGDSIYVSLDDQATATLTGFAPRTWDWAAIESGIPGGTLTVTVSDRASIRYTCGNDDASAVGLLLETIRLWRENEYQPARSILFTVWGGEELAEAGAGYYIEQPTRPLTDAVAMVQLEAIGGGRGFWLQTEGNPALDQALRLTFEAAAQAVEARLQTLNPVQPGSPTFFQERGIPSLLVHWENASALNLPAEADDEIKPERLQQSGETVTLGLMMLSEY